MANTYELISSVTVGAGGASSIDFTSIPSTYTDLVIDVSSRTTNTATIYDSLYLQFNGDTGSNYSVRALQGTGSTVSSYVNAGNVLSIGNANSATSTSNTFNSTNIYVPNYRSSTAKSVSADDVLENNATAAYATLGAGIWTGTAAITSIKIFASLQPFVQYSTAYLYGVKNS